MDVIKSLPSKELIASSLGGIYSISTVRTEPLGYFDMEYTLDPLSQGALSRYAVMTMSIISRFICSIITSLIIYSSMNHALEIFLNVATKTKNFS